MTNFTTLAFLLSLTLILSNNAYFYEGLHKGEQTGSPDDLNYYNPKYDYPQSHRVDTKKIDVPFAGEFLTGYLKTTADYGSRIFYNLYAAGGQDNAKASVNDSAPLIIWIQGGPGCSDIGQYSEMGPFDVLKIDGKATPVKKEITWNDKYHMLFIDSPVGVGYSVVDKRSIPYNSFQVADQLLYFMNEFYSLYPSLKEQDFYIFGESYAGHYIPAIATKFIDSGVKITGIGIGDGWTSPQYQAQASSKYAYSAGIIDEKLRDRVLALEKEFLTLGNQGEYIKALDTFGKLRVLASSHIPDLSNGDDIYRWLNDDKIKEALGAEPRVHDRICAQYYEKAFAEDLSVDFLSNLTYILNNKIPLLIYTGQDDLNVATPGTRNAISHLTWGKIHKFLVNPPKIWTDTDNNVIGTIQHYDLLTYAVVNKAGHMVPMDQPWSARNLLEKFITRNL